MAISRKDPKGRKLREGENWRNDGRYSYRYTDVRTGKRLTVYAQDLPELREKEKQIAKDMEDNILTDGAIKKMTLNTLFERYMASNTDLINLSDSSEQQSMDLMEEMELFQMNTALVKRNIEYDCLVQRCRLGEQQQLDEIVALIVETISIERENITISGVKYPYQFVKSRLLLLEESHIEYVLDCLHENTREVKNIKAYLLTCLMNSITTIGNYYQAKVNHDMYGGGI